MTRSYDLSLPHERLSESPEHREIGVKLDTLKATHAERREAVVMLQASEPDDKREPPLKSRPLRLTLREQL